MAKDLGPAGQDAMARSMRIQYLAGDGDSKALRAEVEGLRLLDPEAAAAHAPLLAWMGNLEEAARLAPHLRQGSPRQRTYEAVVLWQRGQREEGLRRLREIARTSPYDVDFGLAPAFLVASLSARSGEDAEAVEAFRRFRGLYIPTTMWRSWAHPASLATEAEALARLGRHGEARAVADQLLEEWKDAAPEEPLLARALAISGRAGAPALPGGGN
jgi:tetratricopeptide (TPR) repeat protein